MKTLLKIIGILLVLIVALLFILPLIYKSEIIQLTKNELNKSVNAKVDFADMDLSLITSFPNFNLSIEDLYISGNDAFSSDTLVKIKTISLAVDLTSVLSGENYVIKKIKLIDPNINVIVNKNGSANYDITLPSEESTITSPSNEEPSAFNLSINKFQIQNGSIKYSDKESNTQITINGLNHTLSGKLSTDNVVLNTNTRISNIVAIYEGIPYLSDVALAYKANIIADMKNDIYTLGKNELILNNLFLGFDGSVSLIKDDINLVLTFSSIGNEFKDILSLVPTVYAKDFSSIKTDGQFSVSGMIKGIYNDSTLPSFNIEASIINGMFKYPDLPSSVENINITSRISNTGGSLDNTIIDISKFNIKVSENPIVAQFRISTPISDPNLKAKITGSLDLTTIKDFYPMPNSEELVGELILDLKLEGKMSSIENEKYDDFLAMGSMVAKNITISTSSLKKPVVIKKTQLNFSPSYLDLVNFKALCGNSDINATGKITNYLAYYLKDEILDGKLIIYSEYLNIDELLIGSDNDSATTNIPKNTSIPSDTIEESSTIEIPSNINFTMNSTFKKLIYDKLELSNVEGNLLISNSTLDITNLSMDAVGGKMTINGIFSTIDVDHPEIDFNFNMKNMSIPESYNQFAIFRNYIPITEKTTGLFSADFSISTLLNKQLMPEYSTMNGGGFISTKEIAISGLNSLNQIAESLKVNQLKQLSIDDFMAKFKMEAGKLIVKPTKFKYKNIDAEIGGWTGLDKTIGYDMKIDIPRSEFGNSGNKVIDDLMSQANILGTNFTLPNTIPININIGGTLDNPIIKSKLSDNMGNSTTNTAKEIIKNEVGKKTAAEAKKIIEDADKQAQYLISEAKKKAKLIKDNATAAEKDLKAETTKQAEALIKEGKKNGFVAEMAAKEAAKQLQNESDKNGVYLISEANNKADDLIKEAEKAAASLKKDAQKKADNLNK